ncbi:ubiquinol-cytochrome c reductase iron-sulfur subunit [Singulisphaera sp. PoT]|uniref:QcrA and Rieske domain-containing protein n=1 Tax=Singulisphaera sp. PoT TaxID=3411797 RepID=UPI003BF5124D
MNRRNLYRYGTILLGNLAAMALAIPGVAYLLDPLGKKSKAGAFQPMAKLNELKVGVPVAVPVVEERLDAWVKYPKEPIGAVWLVRQPDDAKEPVVAFSSTCPHLGCAINLSGDRTTFYCACHSSRFEFSGKPMNDVPPRPMDTLEVKVSPDPDPVVMVKFARFRCQSEEKISLD